MKNYYKMQLGRHACVNIFILLLTYWSRYDIFIIKFIKSMFFFGFLKARLEIYIS